MITGGQKNKFKRKSKVSVVELTKVCSSLIIGTTLTGICVGLSVGNPSARACAFVESVATLITNDHFFKSKKYSKLYDCIRMITLLYEKVLTKDLTDRNIHQKKGEELNQLKNFCPDERNKIMSTAKFRVKKSFLYANNLFYQTLILVFYVKSVI